MSMQTTLGLKLLCRCRQSRLHKLAADADAEVDALKTQLEHLMADNAKETHRADQERDLRRTAETKFLAAQEELMTLKMSSGNTSQEDAAAALQEHVKEYQATFMFSPHSTCASYPTYTQGG